MPFQVSRSSCGVQGGTPWTAKIQVNGGIGKQCFLDYGGAFPFVPSRSERSEKRRCSTYNLWFVYSDLLSLPSTSPIVESFFNFHSLHASQKHISLAFILKTSR